MVEAFCIGCFGAAPVGAGAAGFAIVVPCPTGSAFAFSVLGSSMVSFSSIEIVNYYSLHPVLGHAACFGPSLLRRGVDSSHRLKPVLFVGSYGLFAQPNQIAVGDSG